MKNLIFTMTLLLCIPISYAEDTPMSSGNILLSECKATLNLSNTSNAHSNISSSDLMYAANCLGFIEGVLNYNGVVGGAILKNGKLPSSTLSNIVFCQPSNVTVGDAAKIVMKYMQDNPEQLNKDAIVLTIDALKKAYPCNLTHK